MKIELVGTRKGDRYKARKDWTATRSWDRIWRWHLRLHAIMVPKDYYLISKPLTG